jgi:hypothetical protein
MTTKAQIRKDIARYFPGYMAFIAECQAKEPEGYTERHHIIPRMVGGSDDASNMVTVSYRDHCYAHFMFAKEAIEQDVPKAVKFKAAAAFNWMAGRKNREQPKWDEAEIAEIAKIRETWVQNHNFKGDHMSKMWSDPTYIEAQREGHARAMADPDVRARTNAAVRKAYAENPNYRRNLTASLKRVRKTPEYKANLSAGVTRRWSDPEQRNAQSERLKKAIGTPEARKQRSDAAKKQHARPGMRDKMSASNKAAYATKEVQERHSAAMKSAWADPVKKAARLAKIAATRARKKAEASNNQGR